MSERILTTQEKLDLEKVQPLWKIIWSQFLDHRMAVAGLIMICFFVLVAVGAPVIRAVTGLDPEAQNPLNRYLPPFTKAQMAASAREDAIYKFEASFPTEAAKLREDLVARGIVTPVRPEDAIFEYVLNNDKKTIEDGIEKLNTPEGKLLLPLASEFETFHLLGTDELGRDVFIRLVYGTRVSMGVGIMVALASTLIGLLIGSLAGYYGGVIDAALMRITDALLSLPITPVLIVMAAIDLNKIPMFASVVGSANESIVKMVFILLLFSWMTTALLVRSNILSLREREFILAASTLGAKDSTIIIRHMFPNVIAPLLVSVTLGVGESILFESALSFLGLGIQQPTPSWGNMLFNAQELITEAPSLAIMPGLLILLVTMSFNYLGDGLQDAIDPKAIRR